MPALESSHVSVITMASAPDARASTSGHLLLTLAALVPGEKAGRSGLIPKRCVRFLGHPPVSLPLPALSSSMEANLHTPISFETVNTLSALGGPLQKPYLDLGTSPTQRDVFKLKKSQASSVWTPNGNQKPLP
ncbi:unnamed protein product [Echinostoma caproni]|uniref:Secreted protein n=1 Tax=Echinostoma caproni TaxID=27848 RepID=A0A183A0F2_9TREM|nr:unnamed protein product [Echinostoma caproni]